MPTLAQVNREIGDKSAELVGQRALEPEKLVDWISDKRGRSRGQSESLANISSAGKLCCIYMKYDEEKSSPCWHPYRYQVTDSSVIKSRQIFFTLSPDGLTQFCLDNTTFIDLHRSDPFTLLSQ